MSSTNTPRPAAADVILAATSTQPVAAADVIAHTVTRARVMPELAQTALWQLIDDHELDYLPDATVVRSGARP